MKHSSHSPVTWPWQAYIDANPWFSQWSPVDKQRLAASASEIVLQLGQALYTRGESPRGLYLVMEGSLKVLVSTAEGDEAIIDVVGTGQWLGELGIIDQQPRQHSAIALEPARCVFIEKSLIDAVLQENPVLYQGVAMILSERLRHMFLWVEASLLSSVKSQILYRLRHVATGMGTPMENGFLLRTRISQELLAAMLGVTRQTLNKELIALKHAGLIKKLGPYYWVCKGDDGIHP